ncbi:NAD(P)/FAD-dependent oxidoreductase [Novosphingopyxis sp.]|uniref:NAD(P)/FAD-dependent oxidoreductase n=1 Tax=Novosphingopyxis sp. TaxID=2709690 RepID=UPI003B5CD280
MNSDPIAIVGASLAGLNAGLELRRQGYRGRLVMIGDEPHRPYDRPPLSKELLCGDWPPTQANLRFEEGELDAEWWLGLRATSIDVERRAIGFDDGSSAEFPGGIVIAAGATPRTLPGAELDGVHMLRSLDDVTGLRNQLRAETRVAVIGAGFIGQEVASSCRKMGFPVTMIEATAPARHVLGDELAHRIANIHRDHGVDVRLDVAVAALEGEGALAGVRLSDGSFVAADLAVVGIGVLPNTDWLEQSDLIIDNGILCDETCLAAPGIVACGDIARWPNRRYGELRRVEHWDNAVRMGVHAARRLLAADDDPAAHEPYAPVPWFWSDQYGIKMQLVGSAYDHHEVRIVDDADGKLLALFRRDDRMIGAFAIANTKRVLTFRRLLDRDPSWIEGLEAAGIGESVAT